MRRADRSSVQRGPWWIYPVPVLAYKRCMFVILLASSGACLAQTSLPALQADEQPNTIAGTVVNAVTGAPIARALVVTPDNRYAMLTDGVRTL